jgi:hypothetical protein
MNEPASIYSLRQIVFDREISNVQNVILTQGSSALQATLARINFLFEICGPKEGNKVFTDQNIAPVLQDLCAQAGIASQILFNGNPHKSRLESQTAFELRLERFEYVKNLCNEQNFAPEILTDREVRNSLTHIDERLADILTEEEGIGWFIDYAASIRNSFNKPDGVKEIKYCRSYVHNESKILHLGHELDLIELAHECAAILAIVFGIDVRKK